MPVTPSSMLPLGTPAPDFTLPDTRAEMRPTSLTDVRGKTGTLVMFLCNHCPYVQHIESGLTALADDYAARSIGIVGISANDTERYPEDGPAHMAKKPYPFPYLYDASQEVARAYQAACTPDFFLFDGALKLVYRGQFDDSRPGNERPVTGSDLRAALDALVAGQPLPAEQIPSVGCNIKWRDD